MTEGLSKLDAELKAAREEILKKSAPLHVKRDALVAKIQPLEAELQTINKQIKVIEHPALLQIGNQIASIARAQGAASLKAE